eukprot:TRINITY_DN11734_c0_g1_i4.p1 TRINITY_DN11734_c0_g1~~TRINITY_DN11734_c0_g1_i4.p1  ORF type:complete len:148 (-),score=34.82 TRINITY_DN11734_c0_g1_i4:61-504(-)
MIIDNPDEYALDLVLQYLKESGFESALQQLESESCMEYNEERLDTGSKLMQLIWSEAERQVSLTDTDVAARETFEEEELLRGGKGDFATNQSTVLDRQHSSNIIAVQQWDSRKTIVTGAGDGCVRMLDWSGNVLWENNLKRIIKDLK